MTRRNSRIDELKKKIDDRKKKLKKNYHEKTGEIYMSVLLLREVDLEFERGREYIGEGETRIFFPVFLNIV